MKRRRIRHGFTFLEIMLVVVIIGILAALVGPRLVGRTKEARITTTNSQRTAIEQALKTFEMDMGQFPKSLEELISKPSGDDDSWKGPYLDSDSVPKDAWNQDFKYEKTKDKYKIWSMGPDKEDGTDDDLGNWTKRE